MDLDLRTESYEAEDRRWLASNVGTNDCEGITLDGDLFDSGTFPDLRIPSGVLLGQVAATGLYGPYDDTVTDGREVAAGILFTTVQVEAGRRASAPLFYRGRVYTDRLPTSSGHDTAAEDDLSLIRFATAGAQS